MIGEKTVPATKPFIGAMHVVLPGKTPLPVEAVQLREPNPLAEMLESLLNLGVAEGDAIQEQNFTRNSNVAALALFVATLGYLAIAGCCERWYWVYSLLLIGLAALETFFLNGFGKRKTARIVPVITGNLLVMLCTLMAGPGAHTEDFFIVLLAAPFLLFDLKDTRYIAGGVLLPLSLFYLCNFISPLFAAANLAPAQQCMVYIINVFGGFMVALFAIHRYILYTRTAANELEQMQKYLARQTRALGRANSELQQLAYVISHDLKAPVRNIASFMNLLVNKHGVNMHPEAKEFAEFSRSGSQRMEKLIDNMVAYCRMDHNLPGAVPVNAMDVVNSLRVELHNRLTAINGSILITGELPVIVNVHPALIHHLFLQLVTNGLKFNKSSNPEVQISCNEMPDRYTFAVKDNGIGIAGQYLQSVFGMFKRLHTENEYDGSGVGLATCKKIVEYYQGAIWIESEPGQGTTVYFSLPKTA